MNLYNNPEISAIFIPVVQPWKLRHSNSSNLEQCVSSRGREPVIPDFAAHWDPRSELIGTGCIVKGAQVIISNI